MFELIFLTSSRVKLEHARYICRHYEMKVSQQRNYGVSYEEPRTKDRERLLEESLRDAHDRWEKTMSSPEERFFLIEDTSVIIHALSTQEEEIPGTEIKYWMEGRKFDALMHEINAKGGDTRVTVRSDLLLYLPKKLRLPGKEKNEYLRFTGQVEGYLVDEDQEFETNQIYPWLDNRTFNKWFAPIRHGKPISMLPIEVADKYDFRRGAFGKLLKYLESQHLIRKIDTSASEEKQISMGFRPHMFVVCGYPCAGKTTLGQFLAREYGYYHIEASDFMYKSYYLRHGYQQAVNIGSFAEAALRDNSQIVVDQILENIEDLGDLPLVVTGFRSNEEVIGFCKKYSGSLSIQVLFVDATAKLRHHRCRLRARDDVRVTQRKLRDRDLMQKRMGLSDIKSRRDTLIIKNNVTKSGYYRAIKKLIQKELVRDHVLPLKKLVARPVRLEDAITLALFSSDVEIYRTTAQIAQLINETFEPGRKASGAQRQETSKNNVSRYFNQTVYPYYEVEVFGKKNRFRLSNTGLGRARLLLRQLQAT